MSLDFAPFSEYCKSGNLDRTCDADAKCHCDSGLRFVPFFPGLSFSITHKTCASLTFIFPLNSSKPLCFRQAGLELRVMPASTDTLGHAAKVFTDLRMTLWLCSNPISAAQVSDVFAFVLSC